jgi:hypothetical protein
MTPAQMTMALGMPLLWATGWYLLRRARVVRSVGLQIVLVGAWLALVCSFVRKRQRLVKGKNPAGERMGQCPNPAKREPNFAFDNCRFLQRNLANVFAFHQ